VVTEQLDIFGQGTDYAKVSVKEPKPKGRPRIKTMQERYGVNPLHICRDCKHMRYKQFAKKYYKCALWVVSGSFATDIRVTQQACGQFEKAEA
jgi:hypothetical protein